jgi:hypothetical protein
MRSKNVIQNTVWREGENDLGMRRHKHNSIEEGI